MYLAIFTFAALQATALNSININGFKPDVIFISVVFFGLYGASLTGLEAGLVAGFLVSAFSISAPWVNILIYGLSGYIVGYNYNRFFKENIFAQIFLSFFGISVAYSAYYIYSVFFDIPYVSGAFLNLIIPTALYTGMVSPIIFYLLKRFVRPVRYI